jgi:hypothetical protein
MNDPNGDFHAAEEQPSWHLRVDGIGRYASFELPQNPAG